MGVVTRFRRLISRKRIRKVLSRLGGKRHALVGPQKLWRMKRAFQIQFLRDRGLRPSHYLVDIGCGTLRGGIPLIKYLDPGHYYGLDVRAEVLEEARRELQSAGLADKDPQLVHADNLAELALDRKVDRLWAFSVLIHMSDDILDGTLAFVAAHLADEGIFHANVNIGEREKGGWQGFPVVWRSLDFYRGACEKHGLAVRDIGALSELGHHSGDPLQDAQRMLEIRRAVS